MQHFTLNFQENIPGPILLMDMNCMDFSKHYQLSSATRTRDGLTLATCIINQQFKHNFYGNYFFSRSVSAGNGLLYETHEVLLDCEHKGQVKTTLNELLFQIFHEKFDLELKCLCFFICMI